MSNRVTNLVILITAFVAVAHSVRTTSSAVAPSTAEAPPEFVKNARQAEPVESVQTVEFIVPANSIVMLGSMDCSAQRHLLHVTAQPKVSAPAELSPSESVLQVAWDSLRRQRPVDAQGFDVHTSSAPDITDLRDGNAENRRRFEVPHFSMGTVFSRYVLAQEIYRSRHVQFFSEDTSAQQTRAAAQIAGLIDGGLRSFVERELAPIADRDGDGRLTILLAQLSDESARQVRGEPVSGCVRASDFLHPASDFGGDIIYLDPVIVDRQMDAIVAHELAHAAIFSMICRAPTADCARRIPCWLNEAVAHFVERRVRPDSINLAARLRQFRMQPHLFPVVIPDSLASPGLKRGPARAAGCLFIEAIVGRYSAGTIRSLIDATSGSGICLKETTGENMNELLRQWGLELLRNDPHIPQYQLAADRPASLEISGTAFRWIAQNALPRRLSVSAARAAQLQVTIITDVKADISSGDDEVASAPMSAGLNERVSAIVQQ